MSDAVASPAGEGNSSPGLKLFEEHTPSATPQTGKRPIAVVGAGFSGTIAALHLLRRLPADQPVLLCERAPEFARGVAYATGDADHLLNVRATNMSALNDEPQHFAEWLMRRAGGGEGVYETAAGLFASRGLYGQYLRSILDFAMRQAAGHAQLRLMPDDVTDIVAGGPGEFELVFAGGSRLPVAGVVLAVGNLPPDESADPRICANPWGSKAFRQLTSDDPVLILGTGLTMVDLAISIRRRGFTGKIIAMSRGGRLPHRHAPVTPWPTPEFTPAEAASVRLLTRRIRNEVRAAAEQGNDWRGVIDSLRPVTAKLWSGLPQAERRRFLRHARRYWDVHRHRMAPPNAALIDGWINDGSLEVQAGRVSSLDPVHAGVAVRYTPRGGKETVVNVQRVIRANGLEHISRTRDPLMQRLLDSGLIRLDEEGLGVDVTDGLTVMAGDGLPAERIWALGPIVRGVFWECIAVPDIRVQAANVAAHVADRLRQDAPRWSFII